MQLPLYQVDAFTDQRFAGNPAAVCVLEAWLPEATMQAIAAENNLAETAFVVPNGERYGIRWFTPTAEVALCGHATLASAKVLLDYYHPLRTLQHFDTRLSGPVSVAKEGEWYVLDFPADMPGSVAAPQGLFDALRTQAVPVFKGKTDLVVLYPNEQAVLALSPDIRALESIDARGVICTAPGDEVDFVSRFFAPAVGVDEDPVTGSAHTVLTPFWADRLGKPSLDARQRSERGGTLKVEHRGDRVLLKGQGVEYLRGQITV
ncbi:MAG: PhzF family phenazine biosynthesis protein [Flavobacteriales bacterium]